MADTILQVLDKIRAKFGDKIRAAIFTDGCPLELLLLLING